MELDTRFWSDLLRSAANDVMVWLPSLVGAVALLLLGWLAARILQAVLSGLLGRLGLDRLAERAGADQVLRRTGMEPSLSHLLGRVVFWLVLLVFVLAAAESLGLRGLAGTMSSLVAYLPRVMAAGFIVLLGSLLARLLGEGAGALASQPGTRTGPLVGQSVRYVLMAFVLILALDQLGVSTQLLTGVAIALVSALALSAAVAFGFGSRELARNIMAGFHAKDEFSVGQQVSVRDHAGRLVSIGPVKSVIETATGRVSLPNSLLTDEEVTIAGGPGATE